MYTTVTSTLDHKVKDKRTRIIIMNKRMANNVHKAAIMNRNPATALLSSSTVNAVILPLCQRKILHILPSDHEVKYVVKPKLTVMPCYFAKCS